MTKNYSEVRWKNSSVYMEMKVIQKIEIDTYESASQMVKEIHDSGKRYDILFTDIEMPGLDGMELRWRFVKWEKQRKSVLSQVTGHTH